MRDQPTAQTIAGVVPDLWLDASTLSQLGDGDPVTTWVDKSGNGGTALAAGIIFNPAHTEGYPPYGDGRFPNTPPKFSKSVPAINGLPAIAFGGETPEGRQTLRLSRRDLGLDSGASGFTLVSVVSMGTDDGGYFFITHDGFNNTRFAVIRDTSSTIRVHFRKQTAFPFAEVSSVPVPADTWGVLSIWADYREAFCSLGIRFNGKQIGAIRNVTGQPADQTTSEPSTFVVIGSTGENNHLSMRLAELLFFRADLWLGQPLTGVQQIEQALAIKYGLSIPV
jgi:hypothetical protein